MLKFQHLSSLMDAPLLYRQLHTQFRQWIQPKDKRHLQVFAENVAAILHAQSACLSHWITYLGHRDCQAHSHLERLSYFVNNDRITSETFYAPIVRQFLKAWQNQSMLLTLDTSMLWDEYCLIEVCLAWGGRSFPLAQRGMEHGSAMVAFTDYVAVLNAAQAVLPQGAHVTLLADRGFEHRELILWLQAHHWSWFIRAKSDLKVTLNSGHRERVAELLPPENQASLFAQVEILNGVECHLATATVSQAQDSWAVVTSEPPSLQTFATYGQGFGGIEPHFKDYKSAAFDVPQSRLRTAQGLSNLFMLLATATLIALCASIELILEGQLKSIDWHGERGLSFLQIGLRQIQRCCYLRQDIPTFRSLPQFNPPPAYASPVQRLIKNYQIEFSKVTLC